MTAKRHIHNGDQLAWIHDDPDAALKEYRLALELDPTLEMAHWRIGQVHFFADPPRTEEAITAFRNAIRVAPKWSESHYWLGLGLAQKKKYSEAIQAHHKAIALSEKEDERFFISLGGILYRDRQYSQAVKAYQEGIRIAGGVDANYCMMLADALLANKQIKLACAEWKRALESQSRYDNEDEIAEKARRMIATHCRG
jgi:tetratricopeptide (TPR) repeat protein